MCLGQCFEKGTCVKVLPADCDFEIGANKLRYRKPGRVEFRSYFKGDAFWTRNSDGTVAVTEYHNIELLFLKECVKKGFARVQGFSDLCKEVLKNPRIYYMLCVGRVATLERRGWVKYEGNGRLYKITDKGEQALGRALAKRHTF